MTDRFSVKRLFTVSMVTFALGSLMAGWGPNFAVLLLGRLLQAAGAGILMPMVMTVLMLTFPPERRGGAMGIFGLVVAFAPAVGPSVAGAVIDFYNWHILFYGITVCALVVIGTGLLALEKSEPINPAATLDVPSVILSSAGFGLTLYGFSDIGSNGFALLNIVLTACGVALTVWFFVRQLRLPNPMLNVRVLANKRFLTGSVIGMLVQAALLASGVLMPIYLQTYMGYSALVSGLVILPGAIIMGLMGLVAGPLFDKHGPRMLCLIGLSVLTVSTLGLLGARAHHRARLHHGALHGSHVLALARQHARHHLGHERPRRQGHEPRHQRQQHAAPGRRLARHGGAGLGLDRRHQHARHPPWATTLPASTASTRPSSSPASSAWPASSWPSSLSRTAPAPLRPWPATPTTRAAARLSRSMKTDVYTLPSTATVYEAVRMLVERGISAAPIVDDKGVPIAFISDGDVTRFLAQKNATYTDPVLLIMLSGASDTGDFGRQIDHLMDLNVLSIATRRVIDVDIHTSLPTVCRILGENHLKKNTRDRERPAGGRHQPVRHRALLDGPLPGQPRERPVTPWGAGETVLACAPRLFTAA